MEALILGSLKQHELTEAAEVLNETLKASEIEYRRLFEVSQQQATTLADVDRRKDEFLATKSCTFWRQSPRRTARGEALVTNSSATG